MPDKFHKITTTCWIKAVDDRYEDGRERDLPQARELLLDLLEDGNQVKFISVEHTETVTVDEREFTKLMADTVHLG